MQSVVEVLESEGFNVRQKDSKAIVKLDGLANPVTVTKDIAKDEYKLGSNDWGMSLSAFFVLVLGLYGYQQHSDSLINAVFIAGALWLFVVVLLTELKMTKLRALVDRLNRERQR
ncbi:hypothetical protein K0J45_03950 [Shewanella alkalitolerans]|uniref:hypothetical protein n=1 Tax=Shewanella alkalitolerans TaxID=2864209 RepID=UPI001C65FAF2|nr:hypothetical protein [Shewanella alkalitolerans]QYJ98402.1 hypothetical protein K0J45_03950 [Shewanella alkalitolerans]